MTTATTDPNDPTVLPGAAGPRHGAPHDTPRRLYADPGPADRVFRGVARAGGGLGIAAVLLGTVLIALVAIAVAVPLATGAALHISEYAPPRLRRTLISTVDLMAAVPSDPRAADHVDGRFG